MWCGLPAGPRAPLRPVCRGGGAAQRREGGKEVAAAGVHTLDHCVSSCVLSLTQSVVGHPLAMPRSRQCVRWDRQLSTTNIPVLCSHCRPPHSITAHCVCWTTWGRRQHSSPCIHPYLPQHICLQYMSLSLKEIIPPRVSHLLTEATLGQLSESNHRRCTYSHIQTEERLRQLLMSSADTDWWSFINTLVFQRFRCVFIILGG